MNEPEARDGLDVSGARQFIGNTNDDLNIWLPLKKYVLHAFTPVNKYKLFGSGLNQKYTILILNAINNQKKALGDIYGVVELIMLLPGMRASQRSSTKSLSIWNKIQKPHKDLPVIRIDFQHVSNDFRKMSNKFPQMRKRFPHIPNGFREKLKAFQ